MEQNNNLDILSNEELEVIPGFKELAIVLSMSEENFKTISEVILQEMEKELNKPEIRLQVIQELTMGASKEQILQIYKEAIETTDNYENLSQQKKDFLKRVFMLIANVVEEDFGESKDIVNIPIELCNPEAKLPTYANAGDAGLDVYALEDYTILPGETKLIPTGIKVAIPYGYELQVRPKSGRALKTKLRVANTPGTIDSGYRDEVGVIIENVEAPVKEIKYDFDEKGNIIIKSILHGQPYYINKDAKYAQLILAKVSTANFIQVENIGQIEGNRGGGFGSTGLK
jgi:dUTP pyrophosphatase